MVRYGSIRPGLGDRPIVERSLSMTRVVLFLFPVGDVRGVEISVWSFGGEPCEIARMVI